MTIRPRNLGAAALFTLAFAIPAGAADLGRMPTKAPVVAPPPPPFSWTGCYLGVNIGGKRGSFDGAANVDPVLPLFPLGTNLGFGGGDETGFIGGGQAGCQWQTGAFVLGFEGDFDGTDIERTFVSQGLVAPFVAGDTFSLSNNWQASLRGRLGWAFDRFMVYTTGGISWANFEASAFLVGNPPLAFSADKTLTGWTVGGGFEWAFTPNWSLGLEYRFSQYDRESFGFGTLLVAPGALAPFRVNAELDTHELTARLNWRFGSIFGWQ
jgi:outer membrane immunogenic protein